MWEPFPLGESKSDWSLSDFLLFGSRDSKSNVAGLQWAETFLRFLLILLSWSWEGEKKRMRLATSSEDIELRGYPSTERPEGPMDVLNYTKIHINSRNSVWVYW